MVGCWRCVPPLVINRRQAKAAQTICPALEGEEAIKEMEVTMFHPPQNSRRRLTTCHIGCIHGGKPAVMLSTHLQPGLHTMRLCQQGMHEHTIAGLPSTLLRCPQLLHVVGSSTKCAARTGLVLDLLMVTMAFCIAQGRLQLLHVEG